MFLSQENFLIRGQCIKDLSVPSERFNGWTYSDGSYGRAEPFDSHRGGKDVESRSIGLPATCEGGGDGLHSTGGRTPIPEGGGGGLNCWSGGGGMAGCDWAGDCMRGNCPTVGGGGGHTAGSGTGGIEPLANGLGGITAGTDLFA